MFKKPLFDSRLVRADDALLIFETFAHLIRHNGPPSRPPVPSPLHKNQGLDRLSYDETDRRTGFDFAQDSYADVLHAMRLPPEGRSLHASDRVQPGFLTFEPARLTEPGYLVARTVIGLAAQELVTFHPEREPTPFQRATILLAGAAYFRTGLVLPRLLPATTAELSQFGVPSRFVENTLLFGACLGLSIARQSPEQIVATYGPVLSKSARKKVRPACRQIDALTPELKLLRILSEPRTVEPPRGHVWPSAEDQPQRTSWI